MGTVGRQSKQLRLKLIHHTTKEELHGHILQHTSPESCCYTDEWLGYRGIDQQQRNHKTVCHGQKEWARDDDGDGIRENHTNTIEGIWTGFRNYLRRFRGVHKKYLDQYAAVFEWTFNLKNLQPEIVQAFCFSPCQRTIVGNST